MYRHILLPTDGSKRLARHVDKGIQFAKTMNSKVTAFIVMPGYAALADPDIATDLAREREFYERTHKRAQQILDRVKQKADAAGVRCETTWVSGRAPHDAVIEQAVKLHCDLIIMASHGRGRLTGILLGSETFKVVMHSRLPVLVVR